MEAIKEKKEPKPGKIKAVQALVDKIKSSRAYVITDYNGMTVLQISDLRKKLREQQVEYKVVKNTLFLLALQKAGVEGLAKYITGPVAVAFAARDPVSPIKILIDCFDEFEKPKVRAGIVEEKIIDEKQLTQLAELPSREELIAKVVGGIKAPLTGMVMVLSGVTRKLVYVLDAVKRQKEDSAHKQ